MSEIFSKLKDFLAKRYAKFYYYLPAGQYAVSEAMANLYKNDPRDQWMYNIFSGQYSGAKYALTKYYSGNPKNLIQTSLSATSYAFRLTEADLAQAEAILRLGGDISSAKALLKTVEEHAGITDFSQINEAVTNSDLLLLIIKENMKNFVAENGVDWFALRRLPLIEIQRIVPAIKSES